ncbi:hypothetical protein Thiosp_02040 [Thiorhodovibrio litoralis]|nr:hypothetical protein [Thiorhodovibrio winogradskyi]WPL12276.1 hypothetical protein Thiosp_02040 [Thiorhodovibrio litoralis]
MTTPSRERQMSKDRESTQVPAPPGAPDQAPTTLGAPGGCAHLVKRWATPDSPEDAADPETPSLGRRIESLLGSMDQEKEELRVTAETLEVSTMLRLRAERRRRGVAASAARLGVRLRAPRRPGGNITIEWFRVQRRGRTQYLPRGKGDRYRRSGFYGALSWEREIAIAAEQRLGGIRQRLRMMKEAELRLRELETVLAEPLGAEGWEDDIDFGQEEPRA